jgi:hypothetical protein
MAQQKCEYREDCPNEGKSRPITDTIDNVRRWGNVCDDHWGQLGDPERIDWLRRHGKTTKAN